MSSLKIIKMKYIISIDPAGIGKTGIIVYNIFQKKIINKVTFDSNSEEEAINNMYLFFVKFEKQVSYCLKSALVIIEDYYLRKNLQIKNPLSTPKFIGGLKVLCKYVFNLKYILQSPVVKKNYIYKGNIKMTEHEHDAWKHLQYFLIKESDENGVKEK